MQIGRSHTSRTALGVVLLLLYAGFGQAQEAAAVNGGRDDAEGVTDDIRERLAALFDTRAASRPQNPPRRSVAPAQGFSAPSAVRIELFGRGGLSLLSVTAEDTFGFALGPDSGSESLSASRFVSEVGWGGGARLMSGDWGLEGSYSIFQSLALSPSWLVVDDTAALDIQTGLFDQPFVASQADLLVGQLVRTIRLSDSAELSLGVGAGWMRVTDSSTDRLLAGVSLPPPDEIRGEVPPDLPPDFLEALVPEVEFTADRSAIAYAGSVGLAVQVGRVFLRPRVDVIVARPLTTEMTLTFAGLSDLDLPGAADLGNLEFSHGTSIQPTIFLLSLDIGFSN